MSRAATAAALVGSLVVAAMAFARTGWARERAARALESAMARAGVTGRFDLRIDPSFAVVLEHVRLGSRGETRVELEAPRVVVRPRWASLVKGEVELSSVEVDDPVIVVSLGAGGSPGPVPRPPRWLREVIVHGARVEIRGGGWRTVLDRVDATARLEGGAAARATVAVHGIDGQPTVVEIDARAEVPAAEDEPLPELHGSIAARDLRAGAVRIARSVSAHVDLTAGVARATSVDVQTSAGPLRIADVEVRPLVAGIPFTARVEEGSLELADLLRALGVAAHPHVAWALRSVRSGALTGTLQPLGVSGDVDVRTGPFAVFDGACDVGPCHSVWGFRDATVHARGSLTADAFELDDVNATLTGGVARAARVVLGFRDTVRVDGAAADLDLASVSPLASLSTAGRLRASARVEGPASDPLVVADAVVEGFVLAGHPLGNVRSARLRYRALVLDVSGARALEGASDYGVPAMRLAFAPTGGLDVDATVLATALDVRALLSLLRLDGQRATASLGGTLRGAVATVRYTRAAADPASPEGTLSVRADAELEDPRAFGRSYREGSVGVDLRWDPARGLAGVDLTVRALALRDRRGPGEDPCDGALLASGELHDRSVTALLTATDLPVVRLLPEDLSSADVLGRASGTAYVGGTIDALRAVADLRVGPLRVGGEPLGESSLHVEATGGRSRPTRVAVWGHALGHRVIAWPLALEGGVVRGRVVLQDLDVAAIARAARGAARQRPVVRSSLSGELDLERVDLRDPSRWRARFTPSQLRVSLGPSAELTLRPPGSPIELAGDAVTVPRLDLDIEDPRGRIATLTARGTVSSLSGVPRIDAEAAASSVSAAVLVGLVPDLQYVRGALSGSLRIAGELDDPAWGGELHARAEAAGVRWIPGELRDVFVDAVVEPHELRIARASARLGGGTVDVQGRLALVGPRAGPADLSLRLRQVALPLAPGVEGTFGGDLRVFVATRSLLTGAPHAVLVRGVADVDSFVYARPIDLGIDLASLAASAGRLRRHAAQETYEASRDIVDLEVRVRARAPLRIEGEVARAAFLPAGPFWLRGTNQRPVLTGRLVAVGGGKLALRGTTLDLTSATLDFDDPRRTAPRIDMVATTEYRRVTQFQAPAAASATSAASAWRIRVHVSGRVPEGSGRDETNRPPDALAITLSSDPPLGQDDIVLLLTVGLTRTELDAMQAATGSLQAGVGLEALAALGGADRIVLGILPVDDFRFDSEYSPRSMRMVPDVTVRKHIADRLAATVTTAITEELDLRGALSLELSPELWLEALWENVASVPATPIGDVGLGIRYRVEFE
jgi:translocation and assembly module TamB